MKTVYLEKIQKRIAKNNGYKSWKHLMKRCVKTNDFTLLQVYLSDYTKAIQEELKDRIVTNFEERGLSGNMIDEIVYDVTDIVEHKGQKEYEEYLMKSAMNAEMNRKNE